MIKGLIFSLIVILFNDVSNCQIEINENDYWNLPDSIKKSIDRYFEKEGIVYMDSIVLREVQNFFYNDQPDKSIRYSPYSFNMRKLITDSLNDVGIFSFRKREIHCPTYLLVMDFEKTNILTPGKNYDYYNLINFIKKYIKKNEDLFSDEEKWLVWQRLSEYMIDNSIKP